MIDNNHVDELRGLDTVRVSKESLVERIKVNRDNHRSVFEEAIDGYHKAVITALDAALKDARAGKKYTPTIFLPEPQDHTRDYDRVLAIFDFSLDDEFELSAKEFAQYVLDDWGWKGDFIITASNYTASR